MIPEEKICLKSSRASEIRFHRTERIAAHQKKKTISSPATAGKVAHADLSHPPIFQNDDYQFESTEIRQELHCKSNKTKTQLITPDCVCSE